MYQVDVLIKWKTGRVSTRCGFFKEKADVLKCIRFFKSKKKAWKKVVVIVRKDNNVIDFHF